MKSEHRHDLQTNELGKFAEKTAVYIDQHGNRLMIGICVAALVASAGIWFYKTKAAGEMNAWADLTTAMNSEPKKAVERFQGVWNDYPGTIPAMWAKLREGEALLDRGVEALFRNVELGTEDLKKARAAFQAVVDERRAPKEVRERALWGLGRAQESLSDGSEDAAIKAYESFVKEFPNSDFAAEAKARIETLKDRRGQEFYAWFSKYPRPKLAEKGPHDVGGDFDPFASDPKETDKKKSDDDEDMFSLPDEKKLEEKPKASDTEGAGEKPAKPDSKSETGPKPEPPAEPETKPE